METRQSVLDKDEVLQWLLVADASEVCWALTSALARRPSLTIHLSAAEFSPTAAGSSSAPAASQQSQDKLNGVLHHRQSSRELCLSTSRTDSEVAPLLSPRGADEPLPKAPLRLGAPRSHLGDSRSTRRSTLRSPVRSDPKKESTQGLVPMVQFAASEHLCMEGSPDGLTVEVIRVGDLSKKSSVGYYTEDSGGSASHAFIAARGVLVFEIGEAVKQIHVDLVDNCDYNTTLDFDVKLDPGNSVNAILTRDAMTTEVKIIDDDAFPTNKYKDLIVSGQHHALPRAYIFWEYILMNLRQPVIRSGAWKMVILGQLHNMHTFSNLVTFVYVLDYVLDRDNDEFLCGSRQQSLFFAVLALLVPMAILYYLDIQSHSFHIGSSSRRMLQRALLRRFMNFSAQAREQLMPGQMITAMTRDIEYLVSSGFMSIFKMTTLLGQLSLVLCFQFLVPRFCGKEEQSIVVLPSACFPLLIFLFVSYRFQRTMEVLDTQIDAMDCYAGSVENMVHTHRLISAFGKQRFFMMHFDGFIGKLNAARHNSGICVLHNAYFVRWLSTAIVAIYVFCAGHQVLRGDLRLGMFVANIHLFRAVGDQWSAVYDVVLDMKWVLPGLIQITTFLNMDMDLAERKVVVQERCASTIRDFEVLRCAAGGFAGSRSLLLPSLDLMRLRVYYQPLEGVVVDFWRQAAGNSTGPRSRRLALEIEQGTIVALLGPHGQGKTKMLDILAMTQMPRQGVRAIVPSHLKILCVASEQVWFHASLYENLVFGLGDIEDITPGLDGKLHATDQAMDRIRAVCKRVGVSERVMELLSSDEVRPWREHMSRTDAHLLGLSRVLIANPDVLCLHKPTQHLDLFNARNIFGVIKEFVEQRGISEDPSDRHLRRPRTCVLTSDRHEIDVADCVYVVSESKGVQLLANGVSLAD